MTALWPNQARALAELPPRLTPGQRGCMVGVTGSGKSRTMRELIGMFPSVTLYTNRRMLLSQLSAGLTADGIDHGIRAAGYLPSLEKPVQLCSVQSVSSRSMKSRQWPLHRSRLVMIDEAHVNGGGEMQAIVKRHLEAGAAILGVTATPLDIGHMYDWLYVAGTTSEMRGYGALVPAYHFAPDEPDTRNLQRTKTGEYAEADVIKAIMSATILGRVIEHWHRLNPEQHPSLLFAPGVAESRWFCDELNAAKIPAAHIDGSRVKVDGTEMTSDAKVRHKGDRINVRDWVGMRLRDGDLKVVCNRFVLREGIDWPWVRHLVLATIFGSLGSYLQSGGRGLRASPGKDRLVVQDHGGNWHRHGSLNEDREWDLGDTGYMVGEMRQTRMEQKRDVEPIVCPKCHAVRAQGAGCGACGHISSGKVRMVVQKDGELKPVHGDIYRPPRKDRSPQEIAQKRWDSCCFVVAREGGTFRQAVGRYFYRHDWVGPPDGLAGMPMHERDWFLPINDVPAERRIPRPELIGGAP